MINHLLYIGADTAALHYARSFLEAEGCAIASAPSDKVTHLLLNVPTFTPNGVLAGGGDLQTLLKLLPGSITVIGGNLQPPLPDHYHTTDLLRNESYLAKNAAITAECALQVAFTHFSDIFQSTPVLILGWGRIGKCLSRLLRAMGASVTVAARKESDLSIASALGYDTVKLSNLAQMLPKYRIIFNTVPAMVLPESMVQLCRTDCLKIDLASVPGIAGTDVITARGLPGKLAPEASGRLIANTILELFNHKEDPL